MQVIFQFFILFFALLGSTNFAQADQHPLHEIYDFSSAEKVEVSTIALKDAHALVEKFRANPKMAKFTSRGDNNSIAPSRSPAKKASGAPTSPKQAQIP